METKATQYLFMLPTWRFSVPKWYEGWADLACNKDSLPQEWG